GYYGDRYGRPMGNRAAGQEMFGTRRYGMGPGYDSFGWNIYRDGYRTSWSDYSESAYSLCPPAYYEMRRAIWCGVGSGICGLACISTGIAGVCNLVYASETADTFADESNRAKGTGTGLIVASAATGIGCGLLAYFCGSHVRNSVALFNQGPNLDRRYRSSLEFGITPSGRIGVSLEF
ncbi:MAG: hypothetical protein QMB59_04625, partial [Bacteroidales bacterium]